MHRRIYCTDKIFDGALKKDSTDVLDSIEAIRSIEVIRSQSLRDTTFRNLHLFEQEILLLFIQNPEVYSIIHHDQLHLHLQGPPTWCQTHLF
jgi:hypothetical protein